MKSYKLFYSWQSEHKDIKKTIEDCLNKVKTSLKEQQGIELVLEEDTSGRIGVRNINNDVLQKIENCDIFIADLTPVHILKLQDPDRELPRYMPNSNVMFEYGYALRCKGENRIILLAKLGKGEHVEYMPFDINHDTINSFSEKIDIEKLQTWILNIIDDVDKCRAEVTPEYGCDLYLIDPNDGSTQESEFTIFPNYKRIYYIPKESITQGKRSLNLSEILGASPIIQNTLLQNANVAHTQASTVKVIRKKTNNSFTPLQFKFVNKGSLPLQNCIITIDADNDQVEFKESNIEEFMALPKIKNEYDTSADGTRITQCMNIINQQASLKFDEVFVHVPHDIESFNIHWHLSSMYHSQEGDIVVNVQPIYVDDTAVSNKLAGETLIEDDIITE